MYCFPRAKINIGLYVTARRPDGYHDLETLFYPIPLHDVLEIKLQQPQRDRCDVQIVGMPEGEDPGQNLVMKVYDAMREEFSLPLVDILLNKTIPTGAGLGGGSSDAAAMMKMLSAQFGLNLSPSEMERRVSRFGADCAFFIKSRPVLATGIGNEFSKTFLSLKGYYLFLVKPPVHVSTARAYALIRPSAPRVPLSEAVQAPLGTWREVVGNDFEAPIFSLHPELGAIKETLYDMGAVYASMSGSGSCLYGLFTRPIDNGREIFPDCFTYSKQLR